MRFGVSHGLCSVLTWMIAACSHPQHRDPADATTTSLDSAGLGQTRAAFQRAAIQNDAAKLATFYADSAMFMVPGIPTLRGRPAIERLLRQALSTTRYESFEFEPVAVTGRAGLMSEIGWQRDVSTSGGHAAQIAYGRYMITWVRTASGQWQMAMDAAVVDSTKPAARPAAAKP